MIRRHSSRPGVLQSSGVIQVVKTPQKMASAQTQRSQRRKRAVTAQAELQSMDVATTVQGEESCQNQVASAPAAAGRNKAASPVAGWRRSVCRVSSRMAITQLRGRSSRQIINSRKKAQTGWPP